MVIARTLFMLIGALGVLFLGAIPTAMADSPPAPCHEMAAAGHDDRAPQPDQRMKSFICCVTCIEAPAITPADRSGFAVRAMRLQPTARILPVGLRLSPETGPPKA